MHSEAEIRKAIRPLLDYFGCLNTTEIKEYLDQVMEYDDEDKQMSESRNNETKIMQRIGNIVSHQSEIKHYYPEGFFVDKSKNPALFVLAKGLSTDLKPLSKKESDKLKKKAQRIRKSVGYNTDWDKINKIRNEIGLAGELFVFEYEVASVKEFDEKSCDRVIHNSKNVGDGLGYDISSINNEGKPVYIEVKTTTAGENEPFYMSRNEKAFFKENIENNVFIYRVYNFNENDRHGLIKKISAKDLFDSEQFEFDCVSFEVKKKCN
ncbi:MAG: DUF3883 domain-containing protein [Candidatus Methanarcanum hacksteinii]|nr:DUF3883 domain-containing protein [Candidatus Methanarcanum hacksteinii]